MTEPVDAHSAAGLRVPTLRVVPNGAPVHARSVDAFPVAHGGVSPVPRAINMRSLLNDDADDDVVTGSDHDAFDRTKESAHTVDQPLLSQPPPFAVTGDGSAVAAQEVVCHGADAELLLSFTRSSSASPRRSETTPKDKKDEEMKHDLTGASADAVAATQAVDDAPAATVTATGAAVAGDEGASSVPHAAVEPTPTAKGGRAARRLRAPPRPKPKEAAPAKRKATTAAAPQQAAETTMGDIVVGETPPQEEQPQPPAVANPTEPAEPPAAFVTTTPSRPARAAREKRRPPPPAPVQPTPAKKPKTSARPKRTAAAALVNYVDVTGSDGDESDASAIMVISNYREKAKAPAAVTTQSAGVVVPHPRTAHAKGPPVRVIKRKQMSQRQYDELISEDRDAGSSSPGLDFDGVTDVVLVAAVPSPTTAAAVTPSVPLPPCEFCRKRHSAHPTYVCRSCRRAYHDKCFVETFKPEIHDNEPIEEQMERLSLHRPEGRSAMLRCTSCQAAFIDFCKNHGVHWDCNCPSCTTMPHKIADYRRVSLKRIIDEHNLEHALKKEKKGAAGATKGGAAKPADNAPAAKAAAKKNALPAAPEAAGTPAPTTVTDTRTRGRGSRRTRGGEAPSSEDITDTTITVAPTTVRAPVADAQEIKPALKPKRPSPAPRARRGRRKPVPVNLMDADESDENAAQAEAMEVDQEGMKMAIQPEPTASSTNLPNGSSHKPSEPPTVKHHGPMDSKMEEPDEESEEKVTFEDLEKLVAITKESEDTWSFKVACSPSRKANESGTYKEATLSWHPKRLPSLKCSCCDKIGESVQWFVQHTDTSLLSVLDASDAQRDVYSYLFVLQRNGQMVPLQQVLSIIRKKHSDTVKLRQTNQPQSRQNGGRRTSGATPPKKESNSSRKEALALLRDVKFIAKDVEDRGPGKRRGSATSAKFACEVLSAEQGKWLKPLTANQSVLRNVMADCGFIVETCKTGTFDLCESAKNPKTCKIQCLCCRDTFNAKEFVQHTRKPLLDEQLADVKRLEEEGSRRRDDGDEDMDEGDNAWDNGNTADSADSASPQENSESMGNNEKKIRAFVCVAGVPLRDPLTLLRLETLLGALEKLGNQADINKTIAAIVKSQETAVAVNL